MPPWQGFTGKLMLQNVEGPLGSPDMLRVGFPCGHTLSNLKYV